MKKDTICRLCSACCPVEVEISDGRLKSAERKSFLPKSKSLTCPKLKASPHIVYSPDRLTSPLIKDKQSTGSSFRQASWHEALNLIAGKFEEYKDKYGPQSVAWLRGMAADWGAQWDYVNRLMNAFGSPNSIGNGSVCHVAREMAHNYTYGAMTQPDIKNAQCIIIWGKNDRNTAPGAFESLLYARQNGAKLIVVDPVKTPLAEMADIWLQIKPGHDGLLAMSMICQIISDNLHDSDFVSHFSQGFEQLKKSAEKYPPDKVAQSIFLTPEKIKQAARLYATTKPACIIDGNGLDMQLQVFQATRSVCMLRALTGNLDKKGGDLIPQPVPTRPIQLKERLSEHVQPVTRDYPLFSYFHHNWGLHVQSCLIDAILDEKPYPVKMAVVQSGNPAVTMADSNRVAKALERLDFLVVIDPFLTKTGQYADVILPASSCFEKTQLNRAFMRNSPVLLQDQVIDWLGDSWPDWKIVFELARWLGLKEEFPWQTAEEAIDYQLAPSGITVDMLRQNPSGIRAENLRYEKYLEDGLATPSGQVEFFSERLQSAGHLPVPYIDKNNENPISFSSDQNRFPYIGISGERTNRFTHTQFHNIPELLKGDSKGCIDIHPNDARQENISSGQWLKVETPRGSVRMPAKVSDQISPGVVRVAWGWGEVDPELNLNNLTDDNNRDPVTGTPSSRTFMCRVDKIE